MYKKDRIKACLLYGFGALAIGSCVALIVFFIFTLRLRAEYREVCLEINDTILASAQKDSTICRGGESAPLSAKVTDYYEKFLLDANTAVFNRKVRGITERSIRLCFPDHTLALTGYGDGSEIAVRWETPEGVKCYTVRNSVTTFLQLDAYMENTLLRAGSPQP